MTLFVLAVTMITKLIVFVLLLLLLSSLLLLLLVVVIIVVPGDTCRLSPHGECAQADQKLDRGGAFRNHINNNNNQHTKHDKTTRITKHKQKRIQPTRRNTYKQEVVRFAFQYLDLDGDGLLSMQDNLLRCDTILYYTILYYTILYYTIYYAILLLYYITLLYYAIYHITYNV